jgi:hypothetical protein
MHFKNGVKYTDDGKAVRPDRIAEYESSNGVTVYSATLWQDGTASCNCPGWSNRKTCKHAKDVLAGGRGTAKRTVQVSAPKIETKAKLKRYINLGE